MSAIYILVTNTGSPSIWPYFACSFSIKAMRWRSCSSRCFFKFSREISYWAWLRSLAALQKKERWGALKIQRCKTWMSYRPLSVESASLLISRLNKSCLALSRISSRWINLQPNWDASWQRGDTGQKQNKDLSWKPNIAHQNKRGRVLGGRRTVSLI